MAQELLASEYFRGTTDLAPLLDKQLLLLTVAGVKPVSTVESGHWVPTSTGRQTLPDDPAKVGHFLASLGLAHRISTDQHATRAVVSLSPDLIQQYGQARDPVTLGRLYGFPETAIAANASGSCMELEEQRALLERAGVPEEFSPFCFSHPHWRDEMTVVEQWVDLLASCGLLAAGRGHRISLVLAA